jgi:putative ubiquitin-RnfH superfamily antitoxin RatB of RatAB toxin-antitoxin module
MAAETINIQVCYASEAAQFLRALQVPLGATIEQAIALSGLAEAVPGLDVATLETGIYAKKKPRDTVVREHDRIELYRPPPPQNPRARLRPLALLQSGFAMMGLPRWRPST